MTVKIRAMETADIPFSASLVCGSLIGSRYGFTREAMKESLLSALVSGSIMITAEWNSLPAGFAWIEPKGAFSSAPYLRLIAVDEKIRNSGIGGALLKEFEERTRHVGRDFLLLVSDFNDKAIEFYTRHGYEKAGALPDFARPGITEIIMYKKRGGNPK